MKEGRFGEIRKIRNEVVSSLPEEKKSDVGLIRKEVFKKDRDLNKNVSIEDKNEVLERSINKYIKDFKIGRSGSNGCIEALHSQMANYGEIMKVLRKKEISCSRDQVAEKEAFVRKQLEENSDKSVFVILKKMLEQAEEDGDDILAAIVGLKRVHEEKTGNIAKHAADTSDSSLIIPRRSRMTVDPNRIVSDRIINKKREAEEYGDGFHLAYYHSLQKIFQECLDQDEEGMVEKPFLHISLHGKGEVKTDGDIVVANGMRKGKLPCEPEIARWIKEEMEENFRIFGLEKDEQTSYTINVVEEGQKYCGNQIQVDRRFGLNGHKPLGGNYQYIQIELSLSVRNKYQEELGQIFADIIEKFRKNFPNEESLKEYIRDNRTDKDDKRRRGVMVKDAKFIDGLEKDRILLNKSHRSALNVQVGEKVLVNNELFVVGPATKKDLEHRMPILSKDSDIRGKVTIEGLKKEKQEQ